MCKASVRALNLNTPSLIGADEADSANLKAAKIILACRNIDKGEKAKKSILEMHPSPKTAIEVWQIDQSSFNSVLAFGKRLKTVEALHGFVANAGLETVTYERTEGYENSLTVNVISTIMLSVLALPKLKETAKWSGAHTNLVIVGSMQHVFAPSVQLEVEDGKSIFEVLSEEESADMMGRYELSKLMVQMCEKEIAERLSGESSPVVVNCVNPGCTLFWQPLCFPNQVFEEYSTLKSTP